MFVPTRHGGARPGGNGDGVLKGFEGVGVYRVSGRRGGDEGGGGEVRNEW